MIRPEYLRRLVDAAHVDLYLSGSDGARIYWPWRMEPPHEATKTYRDACENYVIDSAPQRDDITNADALDTGHALDAEVVSLADVYQDMRGTVASLLDGLSVADGHPFDGTLLLPLQSPYVECWKELGEPTDCWLGIGGLKGESDATRVRAARHLRDAVGDEAHIHGFGWGPSDHLGAVIREQPELLDSLDYSTPVRHTSMPMDPMLGKEHKSVLAAFAGARLVRDLRRVTPFVEEPADNQQNMTMEDFA